MTKFFTSTTGNDLSSKSVDGHFDGCYQKAQQIFFSLESLVEPLEQEAGYGIAHIVELLALEVSGLKDDLASLQKRVQGVRHA